MLNLPSDLAIDLNEYYTAKFHICKHLHHIIIIQFNDFSLAYEESTILANIYMHTNSVKNSICHTLISIFLPVTLYQDLWLL